MSTEQLLRNSSNEAYKEDQTQVSNKVDINILLEKVRAEKKKEKKENLRDTANKYLKEIEI